ncbi:gamma-glutamylcyclotransferase [Alicyclobacillus sp. ALC3]|uniref:gamma-glutamylcyclotransferase n=1 Tax=Alicyclobacillus sp. ALC3 TaxID=2796143 RepID=UPI0023781E0B|nr:gamma-glutamylcyclotransferase [Alicyclobacillus sp. ALC3]WDL97532.1 gamma-glutamylcyclotransferase [Alicyclobacillus sp. ALC3]
MNEHTLHQLDELEGYNGPNSEHDCEGVSVRVEVGGRTVEALVYVYTTAQVTDPAESS